MDATALTGTQQTSRKWTPITPLQADWQQWVNPELKALVDEWQDQRADLETRNEYKTFLDRLRRQWAVETGVLERLYSISESATRTLIEKGFDAALLVQGDTDKEHWEVIAMIKDQYSAIESLYQFVGGRRPMGTSFVKELHRLLTQHQEDYEAIDSLSRRVQLPLIKGDWKREPNFVELQGGGKIEFCPPHEVDPEMVKLLAWYSNYEANVAPEVLAAWLHHRFSLIHPFTDGNGRVARCLATLVFLKRSWFPLVITRDDKPNYIGALRSADDGDLGPLIKTFGDLQAKAVREAFSLSVDISQEATAMRDILDRVTSKWKGERDRQKQHVFVTADALHNLASERVLEVAREVTDSIRAWGDDFHARRSEAKRTDEEAGFYGFQIGQCATRLNYHANRRFYQAWVSLKVFTQNQTEILVSFHGMGRSIGTLVCTAMVFTRQRGGGEDASQVTEAKPVCDAPFAFTHAQNPNDVTKRFQPWLDRCLTRGLDEWRKMEGA